MLLARAPEGLVGRRRTLTFGFAGVLAGGRAIREGIRLLVAAGVVRLVCGREPVAGERTRVVDRAEAPRPGVDRLGLKKGMCFSAT